MLLAGISYVVINNIVVKIELLRSDDFFDTDEYKENRQKNPYTLLVTKFLFSLVLHFYMQPKIEEAMQRLFFIRDNPHRLESHHVPLLICWMKIIVLFLNQVISLVNLAQYDATFEVMANFIVLVVISDLDEVYYSSVKSSLREKFDNRECKITIDNPD